MLDVSVPEITTGLAFSVPSILWRLATFLGKHPASASRFEDMRIFRWLNYMEIPDALPFQRTTSR